MCGSTGHGVVIDDTLPPVPIGEDEKAVTVSVKGPTLPDAVGDLANVILVHPASKLALF